jgi:hypothetical protein
VTCCTKPAYRFSCYSSSAIHKREGLYSIFAYHISTILSTYSSSIYAQVQLMSSCTVSPTYKPTMQQPSGPHWLSIYPCLSATSTAHKCDMHMLPTWQNVFCAFPSISKRQVSYREVVLGDSRMLCLYQYHAMTLLRRVLATNAVLHVLGRC